MEPDSTVSSSSEPHFQVPSTDLFSEINTLPNLSEDVEKLILFNSDFLTTQYNLRDHNSLDMMTPKSTFSFDNYDTSDMFPIDMEQNLSDAQLSRKEDSEIHEPNRVNIPSRPKASINDHMRIETGPKPFVCNICEYRASRKVALAKHIRIHADVKPYVCNVCDYKTAEKDAFIKHLRTHTGDKPYTCTVCGYKAAQKGTFVKHCRTHTGEKPFICGICGFKTSLKGTLTLHIRIHTGDKPFACTKCDYKATQKVSLIKHLHTHRDNKLGKLN